MKGQSQYVLEIRVNGYSNPNQFRPFCTTDTCFFGAPQCCDQPDPVQQACTVGGRCDSVFFYCLRTIGTSRTLLGCSYSGSRSSDVNTDDASLDFSNATVLGLDNPLVLPGLTTTWNVSWSINNWWSDILCANYNNYCMHVKINGFLGSPALYCSL